MTVSEIDNFSPERFIGDVKRTCAAIDAPFSEATTRAVIEAYSRSFHEGAVSWRATSRRGDALNFRFYERRPIDTVGIAIRAGLLEPDNALAGLVTSWSSLYDGKPEQSCDFDAQKGLAKAWVYMGGFRPVDDILGARGVPQSIRRHGPTFRSLGLESVRHVAVDYHSDTVNLYFSIPGPVTEEHAAELVKLAGCASPSREEFDEMRTFLRPTGYTLGVTMNVSTGVIKRVAFYALKLPLGTFPEAGERLKTFLEQAPSYDREEMNGVAWSYGNGGKKYIKAERSYCGGLVPLMRNWSTPLTA